MPCEEAYEMASATPEARGGEEVCGEAGRVMVQIGEKRKVGRRFVG